MKLEAYKPVSKMVTKSTIVDKPRFPAIDAHNHLGKAFGGGWDRKPLPLLLDLLDESGITNYVDLDGGWGEELLLKHLKKFKEKAPERFQIFGGVDWAKWAELGDGFPDYAAQRLQQQKSWGAQGLKIWKPFGLHVRDHKGEIVDVDDLRLDPLWQAAGELNLPVLVHVADPVAFFDPIDHINERWEELGSHPDWAFTSPPFPPFLHILEGFHKLVRNYPQTQFIGAHVGCYAENLSYVGEMLDESPNLVIDISGRLGELGRQPYTARKFFLKYAERILFGSDFGPNLDAYRLYYRFLETDDEYFNYNTTEVPAQGRWMVCGIDLPDDVLKKVYHDNGARVLGLKDNL